MIELKLEGMDILQRQLQQLGAVAAAKVLAKAGRKALKPVLAEMRSKVPVDTGLLRDSLAITVKKAPKDSDAFAVIGIRIKTGKGGSSRDIAKAKQAAYAAGGGKKAIKAAQRAGWRKSAHWRWHFVEFGTATQPARPFLRPAFNQNAQQILDSLKVELSKFILRELRRRAAGPKKAPARKAA